MVERAEGWHPVRHYTDSSGREVEVTERHRYDAATQINHVTWRIVRGGVERLENLDMRCFFPLEIEALVRLFGFRIVSKFGNWDRTAFTSDSPKMILVCKPV